MGKRLATILRPNADSCLLKPRLVVPENEVPMLCARFLLYRTNRLRPARMRTWACAILALCLWLLNESLRERAQVNIWSRSLAGTALNDVLTSEDLDRLSTSLPRGHGNSIIMLGRLAVEKGHPESALVLVSEDGLCLRNRLLSKVRGDALAAVGRWREAIVEWGAARDWRSLSELGSRFCSAGRCEEGIVAYEEFYRLDPVRAASALAEAIWRARRDGPKAAAVLERTIDRVPNLTIETQQGWLYRAGGYRRLGGDWKGAEVAYTRLARLNESDYRALLGAAWLSYWKGKDTRAALDRLRLALEGVDGQAGAWAEGATLLVQMNLHGEAQHWYAEAIRRSPTSKWWYIYRAASAMACGNRALQLEVLEQAARLFPDFPAASYELAWAYSLSEKHEAAIHEIYKAIRLEGGMDWRYAMRAGLINERAGLPCAAAEYYLKAMALAPSSVAVRDRLARCDCPTLGR